VAAADLARKGKVISLSPAYGSYGPQGAASKYHAHWRSTVSAHRDAEPRTRSSCPSSQRAVCLSHERRRFQYEALAGNIGLNIGVAAPTAYFPFSGWKDSFFGVLDGQGSDAVEFYTDKKVEIERWAVGSLRKF
jgi:hypothetical protein